MYCSALDANVRKQLSNFNHNKYSVPLFTSSPAYQSQKTFCAKETSLSPSYYFTKCCTVPPTVANSNWGLTNWFMCMLYTSYIALINTRSYPDPSKVHSVLDFHLCHLSIFPITSTTFWDSSFRFPGWILVPLDEWVSDRFMHKFPIAP